MNFINRKRELSLLDDVFNRDASQMMILYGRRRIGKTTLITHWLKHHVKGQGVYWVAHKSSSDMLLDKFSKVVQPFLKDVASGFRFSDWESALEQIFHLGRTRKLVLAIDEFPYLMESVPEFTSILQTLWDRDSHETRLMTLLSGSHYHMMCEEFLSGKGPLYGRSSADMLLEEIEPAEIGLFLPKYSDAQIVETYSVIGGVPKYLEMWDDRKTVFQNIEDVILSPVTIFRQEAIFLIQDEISEPRTYLAILESIGNGAKSPSQISGQTGIPVNHMGKYLKTLRDLNFIRRVVSLDAADRSSTRLTRYEIRDAYLKFYFYYIYPRLELLEQRRTSRLMELIQGSHDAFVGKTGFEELARRFITRLGDGRKLSFLPDYIGRIWNKRAEIDIAAIDHKSQNILLGECKWSRKKMTPADLDKLIRTSERLTKIKNFKKHYALFSKSGFTAALTREAVNNQVMLFEGAGFKKIA